MTKALFIVAGTLGSIVVATIAWALAWAFFFIA